MKIIDSKNIYRILTKSFSYIDDRVTEHGKRVAYIVLKMLENDDSISKQNLTNICFLALLHDIGAFKTELIDDDFDFDQYHPWDHSIYGYLFLKQCSPLSDICESIRYHHKPFDKLNNSALIPCIIMLADIIDINCIVKNDKQNLENIIKSTDNYEATKKLLDKFICIDNRDDIIKKLSNKSFDNELSMFFANSNLTQDECESYLKMLTYSLDFKSEHHCIHSFFTSSIATDIATFMGLNEYDVKKALFSGLLHDIGKLSIPFDILEKPIKLSATEVSIYKSHINITNDILKDNVIDEVCQSASNHHELLSGSGYPNHLSTSQLSIMDRILMISNIMASLTLKKGYKTRYSKKQVISELIELSKLSIISREVTAIVIQHYDYIIKNSNSHSSIASQKLEKIMLDYYVLLKEHTRSSLLG